MKKKIPRWLSYLPGIFVVAGGINWGLVGIFDFNLVQWSSMGSAFAERTTYIVVALATIYKIPALTKK